LRYQVNDINKKADYGELCRTVIASDPAAAGERGNLGFNLALFFRLPQLY
jgi:hypothetical protein